MPSFLATEPATVTKLKSMIGWPALLAAALVAVAVAVAVGAWAVLVPAGQDRPAPDADPWTVYKQRFVTAEGRVVDTGNDGISHSEGQGWGMLLAEANGDRETFERLWRWTRQSLQWRGARLFAWKWEPGREAPIADGNSASDGDLMIAWALARAAERWQKPEWRDEARGIARDIRRLLVIRHAGEAVLLPGFEGFEHDGRVTLNLSYYVFPALAAMARIDPAPEWDAVSRVGLTLVERSRIGDWALPPDWITVAEGGVVGPAEDWPPRFGYEAVRIPIFLVWAGLGAEEALRPFDRFWSAHRGEGEAPPAWVDLVSGEIATDRGVAGYEAVARLAARRELDTAFVDNAIARAPDYYSASLLLLAEVAQREGHGRQ